MASAPGVGYDLVVVGTSWGGLAALRTLVAGLPDSFQMAVTLVQHRHKDSDHLLRTLLQERSTLEVCEVEDKMPLEGGHIYIAPPDYHTLVEPGHFSLSTDAPVRFSRPSIDVTFSSAADSYAHRAVGIVLTGANADGSDGLRRISDRGGLALVQDPDSAESRLMPAAARRAVPRARVMSLEGIVAYLATLPAGVPEREDA
ncbi:MAG: cheB, two-component system, chemotaxis family, response regulator CheB [Gemmatimonadetes bacterium]|nr:cheB, two-component system, chemotaxis family, response regulator CheB [Gemmatimonadota bacterium]